MLDYYSTDTISPLAKVRRCYEEMKRYKSPWLGVADTVARYVLGRRNFMTSNELLPQDYFDSYIFDTTAISANHLLASSNVGALWPSGAKTFVIEILPEMVNEIEDTQELEDYFAFVTKTLGNIIDNPKCGFLTTFEEYMIEQSSLGTSGIIVEEQDDLHVPISFRVVGFRDLFIDVNNKGQIDRVYIQRRMTTRQILQEYGSESFLDMELENIEDHTNYRKFEVVIAIEPNENYNINSSSNVDFPYRSLHMDYTRNRLLRQSGYREMPVFVGRFWHLLNEIYGRSPANVALSDIRELNHLRYDLISASEKMLFPPVSVIDGCIMGNGIVDLSAKGLNVVAVSGKMQGYSGKPIEQTIDIQNPQWAFTRLQDLIETIKNHFFLDRIMGTDPKTHVTTDAVNINNQLRGQSLNTVYTRQEKEVIEPLIERCFNICLGKGILGVVRNSPEEQSLLMQGIQPTYIPDQIVKRMTEGKDVYRIRFISPASQIRNAQELSGIMQTLQALTLLAQIKPEVLDQIEEDITSRLIAQLSGAPATMIRSTEAVLQIREQRAKQQEEQHQMEMAQQGTQALGNASKALQ